MSTTNEQMQALGRLLKIAMASSGQSRHVAGFLAALYNDVRFKFDLRDFRCLDTEIFEDCLKVLALDACAMRAIDGYIEDGEALFEELVSSWGVRDYSKEARS